MKKFFCDRCKKEIINVERIHRIVASRAKVTLDRDMGVSVSWEKRTIIPVDHIFCEDCVDEIEAFSLGMASLPLFEGAKRKKSKKYNKAIDLGKIQALMDAGWSLKDAAEDIGCTEAEVAEEMMRKGVKCSTVDQIFSEGGAGDGNE